MRKLLSIFALVYLAQAQEITLEPIVVTPYSEQETPFLAYQETTPGMIQPVINGLMGDKILISIDGTKFSNSLFRSGPNQYYSWIPNEFILDNSINETLTNSSLGGTIDVKLGLEESKISVEGSSNTFKTSATYKDQILELGVIYEDNSDVVTSHDGKVPHSSWNQKGAFASYSTERSKTTFLVSESNDIDRTDKFEKDQYYVYELQRYILLDHKFGIEGYDNLMIIPSWQRFEEKIDQNDPEKNVHSTLDMFGITASNTHYDLLQENDSFTYGISNYYEDIEYLKSSSTNYHYNIASVWMKYYDVVTDEIDYTLTWNYSYLDTAGENIDRTMHGNSFGINVNYYTTGTSYVFASINTNFKFPTITNLAEARSDSVEEIANPNLDSEKALTYRLGYKHSDFTASIFYKELIDMIIRAQTDIPDGYGDYKWRYENTDEGHIQGINLSYDRLFNSGLRFRVDLEYLDGKTDYDYISKLQPFTSWIRIDYSNFFAEFLYAPKVPDSKMALKDQTDIRIQDHNYGYDILNLGYKYEIRNNTIDFYLDNILDSRGRVYGSSVDFNERRFRMQYTHTF